MSIAVSARGLSKTYSLKRSWDRRSRERVERTVLDDVSFDLPEGEVLGIIGRNGAGKSTLLKILSRITVPTRGQAAVHGRVAALLEVGTGMHPEMTGRENLFLNGALLGMARSEIARKFDEIVEFAGVGDYIDTPIKRYSSGMKVRLGFAVAAHLTADILIVDEVLAVGDMEFQRKCLGAMADCGRDGRTVLFVSHNLAAVRTLCQRGLVLDRGKATFQGPVDEAVERYLRVAESTNGHAARAHQARESGGFVLERFELLEEDGRPVARARAAKSYRLEISIAGSMTEPAPILLVWVSGFMGESLLLLSSRLGGMSVPRFSERLSVAVDVGPVMLVPGEYQLNIALLDSRGARLGAWERVRPLEVDPAEDVPALSLPAVANRGVVYAPAGWQLLGETR